MAFKTVLAPGAPWPKKERKKNVKLKAAKKKAKPAPKPKARPVLAVPGNVLDFFAEAREQIATGRARGKIRDTIGNLKKH